MEWFETLTLFGYDAESCEIHKDDDDINIVPRVVEKALVPKLACKNSCRKLSLGQHA